MEQIESLIGTLKIAEESGNKEWEGSVHRSIGVSYQETGNFEKAVKHYEAFLQTQELAQDMKGVEDAHRNLGSCFLSLSQYEQALKHFRVVLDIAKDSGYKQVEGTTIGSLATCHTRLGQHEQAIALYEIQLNNAQGSGDKAGEGMALRKLGTCYQCLGQYDKAIEYYEMQLDIDKRVGNERGEGIALANLGNCYRGNGQYDKAIEVFEMQLEIAKRIGDKVGETSALGGLGSCYKHLGHSQKALELYQMGLTIAIEMGDKSSEATFIGYLGTCHQSFGEYVKAIEHYRMQLKIAGQIGDKVGQGAVIGNLGTCYRCLGQYHKAVDHFEMHLRISKEIGDKRGEVTATGNLGCCYQDLGQYHKAIKHHETQLKIGKEIGDKENERAAIGNLGRCYRYLGEYHKAMEHFEMHLKISKEIGDKLGEGTATGNLGNCYQGLGQYSKAVELHEMHLNISKEIGDKRGEGTAFGNLGNCYQSLGQYSKAMEHHAMQLEIVKQIRDVKSEAVAFNNLGMSLYSCGLYEKAEEYCRKSVESYEKLFENTPRQDCFKVSITDTFVDAYKLLAKILLLRGNTKESLMVADRGRSRALAELLIETGHRQPSTSVPASKALVFDDVIELSKAWYSTVIFFAFLEGGIHTWAIQPDGSCICVRPEQRMSHLTDSFVFQKGFSNLIEEITELQYKHSVSGEVRAELHPSMKRLYKILFSPVRHLIQGSQVVVVPDGPLWLVPFAALIDEDDDYLSDTVHLRLVPSLQTAKMIMERPEEQYTVETCPLIVGDPDVGEVRVGEEVVPVPRLPFANREVKLIGQMLNVEPLTAERATKDGFLEKVGSASLIHIAAHGASDGRGILLASGPGGITRVEDVMLTMSDLEHRHVRAKLVVLSCVGSGRGEVRAEGIIGIARAFLGAGARAVVGSLWATDDRSTMYFMKAFYEHLSCGETASEALNNARKSVRQTKGLHHPRYWASFVLIGDDVAPFACGTSPIEHLSRCESLNKRLAIYPGSRGPYLAPPNVFPRERQRAGRTSGATMYEPHFHADIPGQTGLPKTTSLRLIKWYKDSPLGPS